LRFGNNLGFLAAGQRLETPPARTVTIKRFDTAFGKALPPIQHGRTRCLEFLGQRIVRFTVRGAENNPRPQPYALLCLAGTDDPFQFQSVLGRYRQCRAARPHVSHA
jgi:hypothetical protein